MWSSPISASQSPKTTPSGRVPLDRRLIVVLLIVFVQIAGASLVLPILPIYATNRFNMTFETVTLLNAVFFGAQFLAGPFIGRLSDYYGRVPVLIVSQVGTVVSFLMLGLATSVEMLFLARILDGVTGGNIIAVQAYVTDIMPREKRTQGLGYIFAAFGSGFIIGPAAGGVLASTFNYETPYFIAAFAAAVVAIFTWRMLDETLSPEQRIANRKGSESSTRLDPANVVRNSPLVSILLITFGSQLAFAMLQSTFALYGEVVLFADHPNIVELGVGLLLATAGFGQVFTQMVLIKPLVARFGESALVVIGCVIRGLSLIVLVVAVSPLAAFFSMFLFAIGSGAQMPALQTLITATVSDDKRGAVLGLYQSSMSLSIIVGSSVAGTLFALSPQFPYVVGGAVFALMIIPAIFLMRWGNRAAERRAAGVQPAPVGD